MSAPRGLGRGLEALLAEAAPAARAENATGGLRATPVADLRPGRFQPRTRFDEDELGRLAESLRRNGMMQPIIARPTRSGRMLEIVAGERRWRAAQKAMLHEVPVIVRELDDREALELALVENLQREDLGPLEEAAAYLRLREQFSLTHTEIAELVGRSRAHVANTVRLAQLPRVVRARLDDGSLSAGHGRALLAAADPEALAEEVVRRGLSVRETEARAQAPSEAADRKRRQRDDDEDADLGALRARLAAVTGLKVEIVRKGEAGRLILHYRTLEQLDDAIARLERPVFRRTEE